METIAEYKSLSIKEAGYDELWLQNAICDSPNNLGLGELRLVAREKLISSGGKLDILLQDTEAESMYEVEVQLGDTDPSHIIRTIEYWDVIRKKYPQRQHYAVIIAESITKRFFNVIGLLSANIPIIAIQCNIIEIGGKRALVFTKVLDANEEPEDIQTDIDEAKDEKYWENRSSKILDTAKQIMAETKEVYKASTVQYNKYSIVIKVNGNNVIKLAKRGGDFVFIEMKYGKNKDEIFKLLEENDILPNDKYSQARFSISLEELKGKMPIIKKLAEFNNNWWKAEDA